MGFKRPKLVSFRGGEEEEEEDGGAKIKPTRYGTTNLVYGCLDFVWITWNCKLYMLKCLSPNLGF